MRPHFNQPPLPLQEYGLCRCGCGRTTNLVPRSHARLGLVRGEPRRFINGHAPRRPLVLRLFEKIIVTDGCWLWTGAKDERGYGGIGVGGKMMKAHRTVYELLVAPIPVSLEIDHLCRNHGCVNPQHLEPVSHAVNMQRSDVANRRKTRCIHGHEFTPESQQPRPTSKPSTATTQMMKRARSLSVFMDSYLQIVETHPQLFPSAGP